MSTYRLIGDHGHPAGEYDAPDDRAAELMGRELSARVPTARATGYRVERLDGRSWRSVLAWMPARVHQYPVAPQGTVPPAEPGAPVAPGVHGPT